jgi:hypothetical protein
MYNAKTANGGYRITKFTDDMEVESSYVTTAKECSCPAGNRDTCRHRQMLSTIAEKADTYWFLDWDNKRWRDPFGKAWRRI